MWKSDSTWLSLSFIFKTAGYVLFVASSWTGHIQFVCETEWPLCHFWWFCFLSKSVCWTYSLKIANNLSLILWSYFMQIVVTFVFKWFNAQVILTWRWGLWLQHIKLALTIQFEAIHNIKYVELRVTYFYGSMTLSCWNICSFWTCRITLVF